jgi:hypothetical protein
MAGFASSRVTPEFEISQPSVNSLLESFPNFLVAFHAGFRSYILLLSGWFFCTKRGNDQENSEE